MVHSSKRSMWFLAVSGCFFGLFATVGRSEPEKEQPLYVGWSVIDITPEKPVALVGQLHKRISERVRDPLTATVLALETRGGDGEGEQAILVSCDVISIRKPIQDRLREAIQQRIPDFEPDKLFLNATHTHTAPGFVDGSHNGLYDVSKDEGVMKASEYAEFFLGRVAEAVVEAWKNRTAGGMSWGLGHAVVGRNRRARYFDGSAKMYGNTNQEDFSHIEGYEDAGVGMLFFWRPEGQLSGIVVNVACPSQETENLRVVSADFWHDVRIALRERFKEDVFLLPQCGAAGDLSPHLLFGKQAEEAMRKRRGLTRRQEIARRIVDAIEEVLPLAREEISSRIVFKHAVARVHLPPHDPPAPPFYKTDPIDPIEFHVLRVGEVAIATNPFELYHDYGVRIKARSPATLTLPVQLACQTCGYLPTRKAVEGGGYSADKFIVGPAGGQVLVNETVTRIRAMWE